MAHHHHSHHPWIHKHHAFAHTSFARSHTSKCCQVAKSTWCDVGINEDRRCRGLNRYLLNKNIYTFIYRRCQPIWALCGGVRHNMHVIYCCNYTVRVQQNCISCLFIKNRFSKLWKLVLLGHAPDCGCGKRGLLFLGL